MSAEIFSEADLQKALSRFTRPEHRIDFIMRKIGEVDPKSLRDNPAPAKVLFAALHREHVAVHHHRSDIEPTLETLYHHWAVPNPDYIVMAARERPDYLALIRAWRSTGVTHGAMIGRLRSMFRANPKEANALTAREAVALLKAATDENPLVIAQGVARSMLHPDQDELWDAFADAYKGMSRNDLGYALGHRHISREGHLEDYVMRLKTSDEVWDRKTHALSLGKLVGLLREERYHPTDIAQGLASNRFGASDIAKGLAENKVGPDDIAVALVSIKTGKRTSDVSGVEIVRALHGAGVGAARLVHALKYLGYDPRHAQDALAGSKVINPVYAEKLVRRMFHLDLGKHLEETPSLH